jgi:hypothetical protein
MFKMEDANLADIYVFLKNCKCHNLERLFVQVITCPASLIFSVLWLFCLFFNYIHFWVLILPIAF